VADIGGQRQLKKVKASLGKIKQELKEFSLNEGIVANALFSCSYMKSGKHHLFDELDNKAA
jgi:hypothetical protein